MWPRHGLLSDTWVPLTYFHFRIYICKAWKWYYPSSFRPRPYLVILLLPRLWEYDSPPRPLIFFHLRENFFGKSIGAELPGKFRHFQNENLEFYDNFLDFMWISYPRRESRRSGTNQSKNFRFGGGAAEKTFDIFRMINLDFTKPFENFGGSGKFL